MEPADPAASAGKLHLLDLAQLKARLGEKWSRLSEHVEKFFDSAIRRSLATGDTYSRMDELSYIVLFRNLSEEEAQLKCQTIAQDVCNRLFGEQGMQITFRSLVATVNIADLPSDFKPTLAQDDFLEKKGREAFFSLGGGSRTFERSAVPIRIMMTGDGGGHISVPPSEIEFLYRPIWDTEKRVVVMYLCQPMPRSHSVESGNFGLCVAETEDDQATLDHLTLRECAARVRHLQRAGSRILVTLPLAFSTLTRARHWNRYGQVFRDVPANIARDLAILVIAIQSGVPGVRLAQELPKLAATTRSVLCLEDSAETGNCMRFRGTGIRAVGVSLNPSEAETQIIERLQRLGKHARDAGLDAFALGVHSTSLALNAIAAGVRYLEGTAIRPACADPRHAFSQSLEYLYTGKLASAEAAQGRG